MSDNRLTVDELDKIWDALYPRILQASLEGSKAAMSEHTKYVCVTHNDRLGNIEEQLFKKIDRQGQSTLLSDVNTLKANQAKSLVVGAAIGAVLSAGVMAFFTWVWNLIFKA